MKLTAEQLQDIATRAEKACPQCGGSGENPEADVPCGGCYGSGLRRGHRADIPALLGHVAAQAADDAEVVDGFAVVYAAAVGERDAALAKLAAVEASARRAVDSASWTPDSYPMRDLAAALGDTATFRETDRLQAALDAAGRALSDVRKERDEARAALAALQAQRGGVTIGPPLRFNGRFDVDEGGGNRGGRILEHLEMCDSKACEPGCEMPELMGGDRGE